VTRRRLPPVVVHGVVVLGYLAVAVVLWQHVWITGSPSASITCPCGDPSEEIWWLEWLPWAVLHGHNPFFTHAVNAGMGGANGLANTSWYLATAAMSPVTVLFGPIVSFNVLATLAPVFSGWCMFVLCRRLTTNVVGQALAGALWGFSPFVVDNLPFGHLQMVTGFFPPLAALVCVDLVDRYRATPGRRGDRRPGRSPVLLGTALAALIVAQFFLSTEFLIDSALVGAVGALVALAVAPGRLWRARDRIGPGVLVAGGASLLVLAYPTWYAVAGPAHVTGEIWPVNTLGLDGSGVVDPGPLVHVGQPLTATLGYFGPVGPSYLYLGIPLVAFLALSVVVWGRRRLGWVVVTAGAVAWVLSVGEPSSGGPWPWGYLARLPPFMQVQPQRFADFVMFCAALVVALSIDGWVPVVERMSERIAARRGGSGPGAVAGSPPPPGRAIRWWSWSLPAVVGVAVLVPVATTYSVYVVHPVPAPAWYVGTAPSLPQGTRVLTVPIPDLVLTNAMVWQAEDDFRFDLIGGYLVYPGQDGHTDAWRSPFGGATALLTKLTFGSVRVPSTPNTQTAEVRTELGRWGVDDVVVSAPAVQPTLAASYLTAVLGREPQYRQGAWIWSGIGRAPARMLTARVIRGCASVALTSSDPLAGPACVLAHTVPA
jgi:hypothetical protein